MLKPQKTQPTKIIKFKKQIQSSYKLFFYVGKTLFSQNFIGVSIFVAIAVWTIWLTVAGPSRALSNLTENWEASVTMIFGSIVAGGTSMGGGAVAFPVFTKVLHVPPNEAKVFSLAIQSIGMSAASLTIMAMKTKVEWRFIRWTSLGGIPGIILSSVFLAPVIPPDVVKFSFTMMICSFAVVLFVLNRSKITRNLAIPTWGKRERYFSLLAGLWGGIVSGLVGSGMDIVGFSIMVLLFGLCEKVSTPTSVILMAINAVVGFILHQYFVGDFVKPITDYWLAAVPVVVVGAPAGAILSSLMERRTITRIVIGLILMELASSVLLIPLDAKLFGYSLFVFSMFSSIYYWMYKSKIYRSKISVAPSFIRSRY
ncbi:sulfite exporter TauE/SafE family protein [Mastigocoleus sp. MO_188.B34]|uniref:sulfite exporter TauE/SafE family protein n=1 Tax=Mastigocoleus sp. MO_188.B34 TaxID=3036635 RepID=UPI00261F52F1|nr:sulfite exporter TauE/SafE family protein [Mastigocoleus sp. MO_188.B34]MDJ0693324.1 sulfite exporter TauE/SafE family protein [Mastigocoleus sp. MO_188.B34]